MSQGQGRWSENDEWLSTALLQRDGSREDDLAVATEGIGIGTWPSLRIRDLAGSAVPEAAARLGIDSFDVGKAVLVPGQAETRWCLLTPEHARLLDVPANRQTVLPFGYSSHDLPTDGLDECLHVSDLTSGLVTFVLVGRRSPDLLARLVRLDLDRAFSNGEVAETGAAGVPLQILRWDRGGALSWELTVGRDVAEYIGEQLLHAGEGLRIVALSKAGWRLLRGVQEGDA